MIVCLIMISPGLSPGPLTASLWSQRDGVSTTAIHSSTPTSRTPPPLPTRPPSPATPPPPTPTAGRVREAALNPTWLNVPVTWSWSCQVTASEWNSHYLYIPSDWRKTKTDQLSTCISYSYALININNVLLDICFHQYIKVISYTALHSSNSLTLLYEQILI